MADVKEKVGVLTDEISTAGRPIYKTPEGEMVSEKSTTFKYKGSWINIPTIHNGYSYDEEELRIMLDNNIIKPTSTHKNLKAAEKAAKERSPTLRGFNPGGSVEGQTQKAFELNIPIPRAEEDPFEISYPSSTDRYGNVYFGGIENKPDPFNPLQFAKSSWEDAKKKIMDAGVTETDANDPALYNGYLRAVDYFKDMGLGALDLVDAAAKAAIGTVAEIMPTEEKERRFERDVYSIPDAFMGTAGAKSLTQLDDAVDAAVAGTKQAGQKVKNIPKVFEPSEEYKQALAIEKKEQGINGYGLTTEEFSNPSTLIVPSPTKGVNIVNPTGDMKLPRINEEAMSELRSGVRAGTIEYVPIKDFLEFFPGNPLVRDTNKLLNDIETNGMTTPIQIGVGWQGHTAEIFEGNHRLDALIKGGYTHVPAMVDIMSDAGQGKLHSFFGDAIHGQATVGVRKKELPPQQKPSDVFRSFYRRLPQEVKKETFSEKANKAISAVDTKLENIFETVDTKYKQGPLGELERKLTKEQMGKSKGKQNPVQTQKALNLGYSETGYHSTKSFSPTEEIEVFKLPDEVARDQAASQGMTLKELIKYKGLGFNNPKKAHDFLGVHVGTTKASADRFSDLSSYKGLSKMEGARTYELKLKTNKPFLDGKKPWTEKRLNNFLVKEMDKIKDGAVFEKMQIIRRRLAEQGFTHVPYVNEVEDKNNISYAMLVDRPEGKGVNSSAVIRYKDAEFNPLEKSNRNAKFAQGGVAMKDQMSLAFNRGGDTKEIEPDLLDRVTDFFSRERGLERSEKLEDAIRYYLGPYAGSLGQANQLLNPIVGLQDAGEATKEGRYVDAVTDTAAAALPIAGALAAKPLAKSVQSGIDEAVDAVTEVMTGGTFDKGRRKVLGTMVAAPVAVAAGSTGIVDELIAPLAKKVAGSGSLSGSLAKLKSLDSKRIDLFRKLNKLFDNFEDPDFIDPEKRLPENNMAGYEDASKEVSSVTDQINKEYYENTLDLITETNLKKLSKEELEELSDKMFDGINFDLDGNPVTSKSNLHRSYFKKSKDIV